MSVRGRSFVLAAVVFATLFSLLPNPARGLDCPQPDLRTSGTSVPEDEVLTIRLSHPSSYVIGFYLTVRTTGGVTLVDDEYYPTSPATATVRPTGLAGHVLVVTASSDCSGPPWVSNPVEQNVYVISGTRPPPPPPPPTTDGIADVLLFLSVVAVLAGVIVMVVLVTKGRRHAAAPAVRCPRCGTSYIAGSWTCPRDGTPLTPSPPPGLR